MVRPVERFPVNIGGRRELEPVAPPTPRRPRDGVGPVGLVAAACLGATAMLLLERLLEEGRLALVLGRVLRSLVG